MPDIILLRLDAPLMSFGDVMVDQHGPTDRFPRLSMLTGLFANALGWHHSDFHRLNALQTRVRYAARWDVRPELLVDYHTVDLAQIKMREDGWTTYGVPEHRTGGPDARFGTHQRYRHYWANGVMTLAVTLIGEESPTTSDLACSLERPARPLFIGRKSCLPAAPLFIKLVKAGDVLDALLKDPCNEDSVRQYTRNEFEACWPVDIVGDQAGKDVIVYDQRDWRKQIHAGARHRNEGFIKLEVEES